MPVSPLNRAEMTSGLVTLQFFGYRKSRMPDAPGAGLAAGTFEILFATHRYDRVEFSELRCPTLELCHFKCYLRGRSFRLVNRPKVQLFQFRLNLRPIAHSHHDRRFGVQILFCHAQGVLPCHPVDLRR